MSSAKLFLLLFILIGPFCMAQTGFRPVIFPVENTPSFYVTSDNNGPNFSIIDSLLFGSGVFNLSTKKIIDPPIDFRQIPSVKWVTAVNNQFFLIYNQQRGINPDTIGYYDINTKQLIKIWGPRSFNSAEASLNRKYLKLCFRVGNLLKFQTDTIFTGVPPLNPSRSRFITVDLNTGQVVQQDSITRKETIRIMPSGTIYSWAETETKVLSYRLTIKRLLPNSIKFDTLTDGIYPNCIWGLPCVPNPVPAPGDDMRFTEHNGGLYHSCRSGFGSCFNAFHYNFSTKLWEPDTLGLGTNKVANLHVVVNDTLYLGNSTGWYAKLNGRWVKNNWPAQIGDWGVSYQGTPFVSTNVGLRYLDRTTNQWRPLINENPNYAYTLERHSGDQLIVDCGAGKLYSTDAGRNWRVYAARTSSTPAPTLYRDFMTMGGGPQVAVNFDSLRTNTVRLSVGQLVTFREYNNVRIGNSLFSLQNRNSAPTTLFNLMVSHDTARTWFRVNTIGLPTTGIIKGTYAVGANLYTSIDPGGVFVSTNQGYNWSPISNINFEPASPPIFSGYGDTVLVLSAQWLYLSTNGGQNFVPGNHPTASTWAWMRGGINRHGLWVMQEGNLYHSSNLGGTWRQVSIPPPTNWTNQSFGWLRSCSLSDTSIALITDTRLWMGHTSANPILNLKEITPETVAKDVSTLMVVPNPNDGSFSVQSSNPDEQIMQVTVRNTLGQVVHQSTTTNLQLSLPAGVYHLTAKLGSNKQFSQRMVIR